MKNSPSLWFEPKPPLNRSCFRGENPPTCSRGVTKREISHSKSSCVHENGVFLWPWSRANSSLAYPSDIFHASIAKIHPPSKELFFIYMYWKSHHKALSFIHAKYFWKWVQGLQNLIIFYWRASLIIQASWELKSTIWFIRIVATRKIEKNNPLVHWGQGKVNKTSKNVHHLQLLVQCKFGENPAFCRQTQHTVHEYLLRGLQDGNNLHKNRFGKRWITWHFITFAPVCTWRSSKPK